MKKLSSLFILLLLILTTAGKPYSARRPALYYSAEQELARALELDQVVIPQHSFDKVSFNSAVNILVEFSMTYSPDGVGCSMIVQTGKDPLITCELSNATLTEAVDRICESAGLVWWLEDIFMISTESNYLATARNLKIRAEEANRPHPPQPPKKPKTEAEKLAKQIMIPAIEFRQAPLSEVVDFLREASTVNAPNGRNISIRVELQDPASLSYQPITLNLRKISLLDALRYITEVAGLELEFDRYTAIITDD